MLRSIDESAIGRVVVETIEHAGGIRSLVVRGPGYRRRGADVDFRYEVLSDCPAPDRRLLEGAAMDRAGARRVAAAHAIALAAIPAPESDEDDDS
jgi:hypothetical protein